MKRIVALFLLIVVVLSVVSCDASEKAEKYCFNCGSPISKNAAFCGHCGTKMPDLNENETSEAELDTLENSESVSEVVTTEREETIAETIKEENTSFPETEKTSQTTSVVRPVETDPPRHTHTYSKITVAATCTTDGYTTYICSCGDTYTESYQLQTYTATELYNQSVKYVGEIRTYDSRGNEYTLGTGFVISSDGKIVTNYHVIEDAYSADITINDKKYIIDSVLAYDADIDLAVLKIMQMDYLMLTYVCYPLVLEQLFMLLDLLAG